MARWHEGSPSPSAHIISLPALRRLRMLFLFLLFCFFLSATATAGPNAERRILLRMKAEWRNPPALSSWKSSSSSPCGGWNGVECGEDGSVTAISLVDQSIVGMVPAAACDLRNLSALNLYNNSVGGAFPTSLYNCSNLRSLNLAQNLFVGGIPVDVHRLSKLTVLDLSSNNFSGDVPAALGRIPSLRRLVLDNNLFDGSFPRELGGLAVLEYLTLAYNPFKRMELPAEFGKLTRLKYLWVSNANLIGEIPNSFGHLTDLEHLDLSSNNLEGSIPVRVWQLQKLQIVYLDYNMLSGRIATGGGISASNLTEIDLSMNTLSGPIPEEFGKQPNLKFLYLYKNRLSGPIPDGIGRIPTLMEIRLFENKLTGVLPPELGKNSKLLNFEVYLNGLSGELPEGLCAGGALNSLVVFGNNFTGGLPRSLGDCASLQYLQVYRNGFSGEVPAGIWSLPKLAAVIIHGNNLSGTLPGTLPPSLSRMEIEDNRFSGWVPSSAPNLKVFRGSNNMFDGEIPRDLTGMAQLQVLLLGGNRISGEIPAGIGALHFLATLNLSANLLSGAIPAAVGSPPVLSSLDLSGNRLSGEIPWELGRLKLNLLNLSSNSLTGEIPRSLQNQAYDRSFLSNPGLCSSSGSLNLPACDAKPQRFHGPQKGQFTPFLVLGMLALFVTLLFGFFVVGKLRRRKNSDDVSSWKLTCFQSLDLSNIISRLTADNLLGSSGQAYRVPLGDRFGEVVAVKKICSKKKSDSKLERKFENVVKILGSIRHPNTVKLLCYISSADWKLLVYEYMENGSLDEWLHGKGSSSNTAGGVAAEPGEPGSAAQRGVLDWPERLSVAVGVARGLVYMHNDCSSAIVHRNVKSSNILLDAELKPKVADFGLAHMMVRSGKPDTVSAVCHSFGYMAPECAYSRKVSEKVDVYSFGVVLLELTTGRRANDGGDEHGCLAEWAWHHFQEDNPVEEALDKQIRNPLYVAEMSVVLRMGLICTGTLPSTRPSMKEVLQVLLWCAQMHGDGGKPGRENGVAPLLGEYARPPSDADEGDDDKEGGPACGV